MSGERELAARVEALERRLRAAEDVQAIERLKARYGELVDRRYAGGRPRPRDELERLAAEIAALFAEDAVWDGGHALGSCRGRQAIRRRMAEPTLRFSWHYFVKPHIEVAGDRARGRWDLLAPCTTADGRAVWMAGVEEDEYVREGAAWLHASMRLEIVFFAPHARGWAAGPEPG
jgi:hypothetical protein